MKNAGKTITLYNYFTDPVTGYDKSSRTLIRGVSVFSQTKVNVEKDGLSSADVYTLRIPEGAPDASYVPPVDYLRMDDKSGSFTFAKGDKIVLLEAEEAAAQPGELEKRYGRDSVVTITGVTDNREKRSPHWKVICE